MNAKTSDTPRTDAISTFRPEDDGMTDFVPSDFARQLERENAELRAIFPEILKCLKNGSACSAECSLEFINRIPNEVHLVIRGKDEEIAKLSAKLEKLLGLEGEMIPPSERGGWHPIEPAIPSRRAIYLIRAVTKDGYITDPYCSWRNQDGTFPRWPHPFPPTHYAEIPQFNSEPKGAK